MQVYSSEMEAAVIIEQNTKTPGPATIVTEQGVFLYVPNGPGFGVIVPLEGSQGPSRPGFRGNSRATEGLDKSLSEAESDPESPEEPESE